MAGEDLDDFNPFTLNDAAQTDLDRAEFWVASGALWSMSVPRQTEFAVTRLMGDCKISDALARATVTTAQNNLFRASERMEFAVWRLVRDENITEAEARERLKDDPQFLPAEDEEADALRRELARRRRLGQPGWELLGDGEDTPEPEEEIVDAGADDEDEHKDEERDKDPERRPTRPKPTPTPAPRRR